jgi:hypothetical protein
MPITPSLRPRAVTRDLSRDAEEHIFITLFGQEVSLFLKIINARNHSSIRVVSEAVQGLDGLVAA